MLEKKQRILITGASGFTGIHACSHFQSNGYEVTALCRNHLSAFMVSGVKWKHADLLNKDAINQVLRETKPEFILHLAGQNNVATSWSDPTRTIELNVLATLYLLESTRILLPQCKVVVVGSALQPLYSNVEKVAHPYSLSKMLQEYVAEAWHSLFNLNVVIAKPSNLIGPGPSNGVCSILAKQIVAMEGGKYPQVIEIHSHQTRDFLDVRDAVQAYEILIQSGIIGETYTICTGKLLSLEQVVENLKKNTSIPFDVTVVSVPSTPAYTAIPSKIIELGWIPEISLEQSIQDIMNYYRKLDKNKNGGISIG